MKKINGKLLMLFASALLFYGCEKDEDLMSNVKSQNHEVPPGCDQITFEGYEGFITEVTTDAGFGPILVEGVAITPEDTRAPGNRAMIYDSGVLTGDDDDLLGEHGNLLIVQQLGETEPSDNYSGGELTLTFPEPVTLESMLVKDIDDGTGGHPLEDESYVYLYVEGDPTPIAIKLDTPGDGIAFEVDLLSTENVVRLVVDFDGAGAVGSGAIDNIIFCEEEETGCTRTQGYWKNHASGRKADPAWGSYADDIFYGSGLTYLQVLNTPPKGGDEYFILAHQYIAAFLNMESGASSPAEVDAAFEGATGYFEGDNVSRAQVLEWADILDDYNNGLIGPGHCDD